MDNGGVGSTEVSSRSPYCSGICDWCSGPNDGSKNWYLCPGCYDQWQGSATVAPVFHQKVSLKGVQATAGHIKDIKARKIAEDGRSVIREKGNNPRYFFGGSNGR